MSDPTPAEHGPGCRNLLVQMAAEEGVEVTASEAPPLVPSPYGVQPFTCPHGTRYYIEPTGDQIARWVESRTP